VRGKRVAGTGQCAPGVVVAIMQHRAGLLEQGPLPRKAPAAV